MRPHAEMLHEAVDDLVSTVAERFVLHRRHDVSNVSAMQAFAEDHRHEADATAPDADPPARVPDA